MSFKNILVAIDRLPLSVKVFEEALELAQKQKASLIIVHCLNDPTLGETAALIDLGTGVGSYPAGIGNLQQFDQENLQREIEQVEEWLQPYWQKATNQGVPTEFDYKVGEPGTQICDLARSWSADLVVVGRRDHKGMTDILTKSVSHHVLHHAPCPVLVIREKASDA